MGQFFLRTRLHPELKKWKSRDKPLLPAPHDEYIELETAKAFGYGLSDWRNEPVMYRARMIAHEIERSLREAVMSERLRKNPGTEAKANPWSEMRKNWRI